eukprot:scaffold64848_cov60-Phaeocystis_antarctica.AAC.2
MEAATIPGHDVTERARERARDRRDRIGRADRALQRRDHLVRVRVRARVRVRVRAKVRVRVRVRVRVSCSAVITGSPAPTADSKRMVPGAAGRRTSALEVVRSRTSAVVRGEGLLVCRDHAATGRRRRHQRGDGVLGGRAVDQHAAVLLEGREEVGGRGVGRLGRDGDAAEHEVGQLATARLVLEDRRDRLVRQLAIAPLGHGA